MLHPDVPLIPVSTYGFGSWQVRVERRPLARDALAAAYDRAAPRWSALTERLGYTEAYDRVFDRFFATHGEPTSGRPLRVLDCGVGTGDFSLALARHCDHAPDLTALDISAGMCAAAEARFREAGLSAEILQCDASALPFDDARFDLVISAHMLEHLADPVAALREARRVLRPGGSVLACLTRSSWLGAWIQTKWRTHRLSPALATRWLNDAGFEAGDLDHAPRGLFALTSLSATGRKPVPVALAGGEP